MRFFEALFDSLKNEMHAEFADVKSRLDAMEVRMNRQGALIQNGARWVTRMIEWSESMDRLLADRDRRIDALEERIHNLEHPRRPPV